MFNNIFNNLPISIGDLLFAFAQKNSDVLWIRSTDYTKQIYLSPSYESIWGRSVQEVYDHPEKWVDTLHPEDKIRLNSTLKLDPLLQQHNTSHVEEYRILRPDGEIRWIRDESFALFDYHDHHIGYAGIAQDVTHIKQLVKLKEQAECANLAKSEFLSSISHDLRTPLMTIINVADILQKRYQNNSDTELFKLLTNSSHSLLELIEEILTFTKLEADMLPLKSEAFNFKQLIEEVVDILSPQIRKKSLQVIIDYHEKIPCYLIGDAFRARRILINLISNAMKFTEQGHILVAVDEVTKTDNHIELQLSIEDTGIGIAQENINNIFERFTKVESSYHGRYGGCGLGLTIVRKLLEGLGGDISVNSQLGKGSTFYCTMEFELQVTDNQQTLWSQTFQDLQILVIDDHALQGKNIIKQFASPHAIHCTSEAAQATILLSQTKQRSFDMILISDEIRSQSAFDLARWIHSQILNEIPMIIFMLQPSHLSVLNQATTLGFDYLIKPLQPSEMLQKLTLCWQRWLAKKDSSKNEISQCHADVLLVEDEPSNQKIMSILLHDELGCNVHVASNGRDAIRLFKENRYDLILMDIGLPDGCGLDITRQLILMDDADYPTPVVGLTAHADDEIRKKCLAVGMLNQLTKPVSLTTLKGLVTSCMKANTVSA